MAWRLTALCTMAAMAAGGLLTAQQPTFRAEIDLVTFGVTVVDRRGQLVTDLTVDDFQVFEDGTAQTIEYFAQGDAEETSLHLGLMLDTSGSMQQDLSLARSAAIRFLNLLPEAEDITLVDFDTEVRVTRYPQRDFARLVERIRMRKPDGWTALYDAMAVYLDGAESLPGRRILVVYTDGADTRSSLSYPTLLDMLRASTVTVYAVGLVDRMGSARHDARRRLVQIVETTGGRAFFPSALKDLDSAYAQVLDEVTNQYHLGYISTNDAMDGSWRRVELKLSRPGLTVRTRKGYFAHYREAPVAVRLLALPVRDAAPRAAR